MEIELNVEVEIIRKTIKVFPSTISFFKCVVTEKNFIIF